MPASDKRAALFDEARTELRRLIEDAGVDRLAEPQRGNELSRLVRQLGQKYPGLDGQLTRRLLAEGMNSDSDEVISTNLDPDSPPSGHANVTSLQREERRSGRDRRAS